MDDVLKVSHGTDFSLTGTVGPISIPSTVSAFQFCIIVGATEFHCEHVRDP